MGDNEYVLSGNTFLERLTGFSMSYSESQCEKALWYLDQLVACVREYGVDPYHFIEDYESVKIYMRIKESLPDCRIESMIERENNFYECCRKYGWINPYSDISKLVFNKVIMNGTGDMKILDSLHNAGYCRIRDLWSDEGVFLEHEVECLESFKIEGRVLGYITDDCTNIVRDLVKGAYGERLDWYPIPM